MTGVLENVNVISNIELAKKIKSRSIKTKPSTFKNTKNYWYSNIVVEENTSTEPVETPIDDIKTEVEQAIIPESVETPIDDIKTEVEQAIIPESVETPNNEVKTEPEQTQEVKEELPTTANDVEKEEIINLEKQLGAFAILVKIGSNKIFKKGKYKPIKLNSNMFANTIKNSIELKKEDVTENLSAENKEEPINVVQDQEEIKETQEVINQGFAEESKTTEEINNQSVIEESTTPVVETKEENEPIVQPEEQQLRDEIQIVPDRPQEYQKIIENEFKENEVMNVNTCENVLPQSEITSISSEEVKKMVAENVKEEVNRIMGSVNNYPNDIRVAKNSQQSLRFNTNDEASEIERLITETLEKIKNRKEKSSFKRDTYTRNDLQQPNKLSRLDEMMDKYRTKQTLKETLSNSISEIQQREIDAQNDLEEKKMKFQQAEIEFERRLQELDDEIEKYQTLIEDSNRKLEELSQQSQYEQDKLEALYAAIGSLA